MKDYGVFANLVSKWPDRSLSAAAAITLAFMKRSKWQPPEEPCRGSQRDLPLARHNRYCAAFRVRSPHRTDLAGACHGINICDCRRLARSRDKKPTSSTHFITRQKELKRTGNWGETY